MQSKNTFLVGFIHAGMHVCLLFVNVIWDCDERNREKSYSVVYSVPTVVAICQIACFLYFSLCCDFPAGNVINQYAWIHKCKHS